MIEHWASHTSVYYEGTNHGAWWKGEVTAEENGVYIGLVAKEYTGGQAVEIAVAILTMMAGGIVDDGSGLPEDRELPDN